MKIWPYVAMSTVGMMSLLPVGVEESKRATSVRRQDLLQDPRERPGRVPANKFLPFAGVAGRISPSTDAEYVRYGDGG
jgi:hypothetical protein